jgi:hypothetical protein
MNVGCRVIGNKIEQEVDIKTINIYFMHTEYYPEVLQNFLRDNLQQAGHGNQAVYGNNYLRSRGRRDHVFESHSGHGCLVFVLCMRFSVFEYR